LIGHARVKSNAISKIMIFVTWKFLDIYNTCDILLRETRCMLNKSNYYFIY